jgi:hypothetical protein
MTRLLAAAVGVLTVLYGSALVHVGHSPWPGIAVTCFGTLLLMKLLPDHP